MSGLEVIRVRIEFDALVLSADFTDDPTAYDWIAATLRRLLAEYGLKQSSRINVGRMA